MSNERQVPLEHDINIAINDPFWVEVATNGKCDHMSLLSSHVTSVTTSWTFGHHGHKDIMDIWTSRTFGHHRHLDIMDI